MGTRQLKKLRRVWIELRWKLRTLWWLLTGQKIHGEWPCPWKEEESYVCEECKRLCCYCFGCADEWFDLCDDCTAKKMKAQTLETP